MFSLHHRPEEPEKHPWCQVMVAMVTHCKEEAVPDLLKTMGDLKETRPLSVKVSMYRTGSYMY